MDQTQLTLLALLLGAVIGGGVSALIFSAFRLRDRAIARTSDDVPAGVSAILAAMDDAAIVTDASSTVLAASAPAEVFGLRVGEVIPSDEVRTLARLSRDSGAPATENLRLQRGAAPSEPRLVAARATAISPRLTLVLIRDITERERVEEMRRDFVANTSHELKTPVGAVSLLAEAIEMAADDPDQVRIFTARLSAEASRLGALTSRIMSLSRLQASAELTEVRDVSIDEVVASAVDAHTLQADSAQVSIVRGGTRGLYVRGEAQVLSEAVGNLIANAIAYSPQGSSVGVGVKATDDVVEIAVTDRGIGIHESDQNRVFERFYRADQARSRRTGGTGLGLSIVKHAVQRHGGEVRLWSRPGRGSTFTIRLPLADVPEDRAPRTKARRKPRKAAAPSRSTPVKGETA
ncbi:two-component system sensor histidine kinase SenX3 [Microbacterium sp. AG1240]|uniref:sensor histidine kinase n=1 Tax=Microbacterium sp. AG1240 TaxID=2183992 RepID=UPI000EACDC81|nr:ATP-binding protein [Microbacterium sp. AG1240]RKT33468.1 two-component system sensor histidine kinase SenX3 [Microbacterium sp. AG1240]